MFKIGDYVTLLYPENSTWNDTQAAINDGTLVVGNCYRVTKASHHTQGSESIRVYIGSDEEDVEDGEGNDFGLSAACFELFSGQNKVTTHLPEFLW